MREVLSASGSAVPTSGGPLPVSRPPFECPQPQLLAKSFLTSKSVEPGTCGLMCGPDCIGPGPCVGPGLICANAVAGALAETRLKKKGRSAEAARPPPLTCECFRAAR